VHRTVINDRICAAGVKYRPLSTRDECEAVVALEREIWGPRYDEAIPVALLLVTATRGAILIGAFDGDDRMIGFVYSLRGLKNGRPIQWSYKLGVVPPYRNEGIGMRLKLLQRERALEAGIDLIEWTFDPMLAPNAYLNLTKLGAIVQEYAQDLYGESLAPVMHRGIPTDRVVAAWNLRDARVERWLSSPILPGLMGEENTARAGIEGAVQVNRTTKRGEWLECAEISLGIEAPGLMIEIPTDFSDMLSCAPAIALDWRLLARRIFVTYFGRGYSAINFLLNPSNPTGTYLLVPTSELSHYQGPSFLS
jgi:chorismate synthase